MKQSPSALACKLRRDSGASYAALASTPFFSLYCISIPSFLQRPYVGRYLLLVSPLAPVLFGTRKKGKPLRRRKEAYRTSKGHASQIRATSGHLKRSLTSPGLTSKAESSHRTHHNEANTYTLSGILPQKNTQC